MVTVVLVIMMIMVVLVMVTVDGGYGIGVVTGAAWQSVRSGKVHRRWPVFLLN